MSCNDGSAIAELQTSSPKQIIGFERRFLFRYSIIQGLYVNMLLTHLFYFNNYRGQSAYDAIVFRPL